MRIHLPFKRKRNGLVPRCSEGQAPHGSSGQAPRRSSGQAPHGSSGQAIIFLVMILVILVFIVLWNFDLHKVLYAKSISQNAGDAAALAAARWQATSLNIMGDLNIMQAVALMERASGRADESANDRIADLQGRVGFVGPMIALMASQQAAKNNRIHNNDRFTAYLQAHAQVIRDTYPEFISEAYPDCLRDYAGMLETVCSEGIAAGPDSMQLYSDFLGSHVLLNRDFYDAVATRAWCWFYFNAMSLLDNYDNWRDWPPLPPIAEPTPVNCEFFGLQLRRYVESLTRNTAEKMDELASDRGLPGGSIDYSQITQGFATFYMYGESWYEMFRMSEPGFPAAGLVRDKYNYSGADSAVRIVAEELDLRTPGATVDRVTWTAAAKPFGYLNDNDKPTMLGVVLPAFHDVRLIPVDASSAPSGGSFDLDWREHCEDHLPEYMADGVSGLSGGCWFCSQLRTWENDGFRRQGRDWLSLNSAKCYSWSGPGGNSGGGTRRGH